MKALFEDRDAASEATEKIKIFAQPQRLMILSCLLRGEHNVREIADATGLTQPALSQQLGELRRAELVQTRKEAKHVWYSLADDGVAQCVRTIEVMFAGVESADPPGAEKPRVSPPTPSGVAAFAQVLEDHPNTAR